MPSTLRRTLTIEPSGDCGDGVSPRATKRALHAVTPFAPRPSKTEIERLLPRVREEFREMPGLRLTPGQAMRLWGLDLEMCRAVIDALVAVDYLRWTPGGLVTMNSEL